MPRFYGFSTKGSQNLINSLEGEDNVKEVFFTELFEDYPAIIVQNRNNQFSCFDFYLTNIKTNKKLRIEIECEKKDSKLVWEKSTLGMVSSRQLDGNYIPPRWHGLHIPERKLFILNSDNTIKNPVTFKDNIDSFDLYMRFSSDLKFFWCITWNSIKELFEEYYEVPNVDRFKKTKIHDNPNTEDDVSNTNQVLCIVDDVVLQENGKRLIIDDKNLLRNKIIELLN